MTFALTTIGIFIIVGTIIVVVLATWFIYGLIVTYERERRQTAEANEEEIRHRREEENRYFQHLASQPIQKFDNRTWVPDVGKKTTLDHLLKIRPEYARAFLAKNPPDPEPVPIPPRPLSIYVWWALAGGWALAYVLSCMADATMLYYPLIILNSAAVFVLALIAMKLERNYQARMPIPEPPKPVSMTVDVYSIPVMYFETPLLVEITYWYPQRMATDNFSTSDLLTFKKRIEVESKNAVHGFIDGVVDHFNTRDEALQQIMIDQHYKDCLHKEHLEGILTYPFSRIAFESRLKHFNFEVVVRPRREELIGNDATIGVYRV